MLLMKKKKRPWSKFNPGLALTGLRTTRPRGVGRIRDIYTFMQTRDELEGLHNCREFSQSLECLYQAIQTQEKSFQLLF